MKLNHITGLATALLAASVSAKADMPKAVCPPSPAQVSVSWEIVSVPKADWNRLSAKPDKPGAITPAEAIRQGHYATISGTDLTTTDGVEAAVSTKMQVPFGPPEKRGFVSIGTETRVKPRINPDGSITLDFRLRDTELAGPPASPNDPPPTSSASLQSIRAFRSGESAIVGGLSVSNDKNIQVVLLTPTIKAAK